MIMIKIWGMDVGRKLFRNKKLRNLLGISANVLNTAL